MRGTVSNVPTALGAVKMGLAWPDLPACHEEGSRRTAAVAYPAAPVTAPRGRCTRRAALGGAGRCLEVPAAGGLRALGVRRRTPRSLRRRSPAGRLRGRRWGRPRPHVNAVLVGHVAPSLVAGLVGGGAQAAATAPHRSRRRDHDDATPRVSPTDGSSGPKNALPAAQRRDRRTARMIQPVVSANFDLAGRAVDLAVEFPTMQNIDRHVWKLWDHGGRLDGLRMGGRREFQPSGTCSAWELGVATAGVLFWRDPPGPHALRPSGDNGPRPWAAVPRGWNRGRRRCILTETPMN